MKVAVVGLGRFGVALAEELRHVRDVHLVAVERDRGLVNRLNHEHAWVTHFEGWDVTDLNDLGIDKSLDVAVVAIGEDVEEAQRWVVALLDLKVKRIFARAQGDMQARVMERLLDSKGEAGHRHRIIQPEGEAARRLGRQILLKDLNQVVGIRDSDHSLATLDVPAWVVGHTLKEAKVRAKFNVNVLRLRRRPDPGQEGKRVEVIPVQADTLFQEGDEVSILGVPQHIQEFIKGP